MAIDVLLDPVTWDLPTKPAQGTGIEVIRQRLMIRLRRFLGEWILDETKGLKYMEWTTTKPVPLDEIGADLRREIETTPEVDRIISGGTATWDQASRTVSFTATVRTVQGELAVAVSPIGDGPGNRNPAVTIGIVTQGSGRIGS